MKTRLILLAALALPAFSQSTVKDALVKHWKVTGEFTLKVAEAMPAEHYSFRPVPEEMTFGQQMTHLGAADIGACAAVSGMQRPDEPEKVAAWRKDQKLFEAITAYQTSNFNVADAGGADRVPGAEITYDFPRVLGVEPLVGRSFTAEEDKPKAAPVVLLSEALWRRRFGADRNVVGQPMRLNGTVHTIIGVMPAAASFPDDVQLWVPMQGDVAPAFRGPVPPSGPPIGPPAGPPPGGGSGDGSSGRRRALLVTRIVALVDPKTTNAVLNLVTNDAGVVQTNLAVRPQCPAVARLERPVGKEAEILRSA